MKPDFAGWATKNGLECSDGRTIMPGAFRDQDDTVVPLVWQHGHNSPENVLGHVRLQNRDEGVYCEAFFNDTGPAKHAKRLVQHRDINMLSIWANKLIERSKKVLHGSIREVSLVLSGANPGALIDTLSIAHDFGGEELEGEAIIHTGLALIHSEDGAGDQDPAFSDDAEGGDADADTDTDGDADVDPDANSDGNADDDADADTDADSDADADGNADDNVEHAEGDEPPMIDEIIDGMSDTEKGVMLYMMNQAAEAAVAEATAEHSDINNDADQLGKEEEDTDMGKIQHNAFEDNDKDGNKMGDVLCHDDMTAELYHGILESAEDIGSLKKAAENFALAHGITDISTLFPEAKTITDVPEFRKRRTEWVNVVLEGVRKNPFSRIKTISADLTYEDARAKGYVKGSLKKEEFIPVLARVTLPTTIYKKQKLDRDDMVDITDFDVVAWLKGEMRVMLDEELARAILMGDGRDISHEDKINEQSIRPIANDHELYTTTVNVNLDDASSQAGEIVDKLIMNRKHLRGSGLPTMFTTETYIALFMLLKDTTGRRIYRSLEELATELRVKEIVAVEAMEEYDDLVAIICNPIDYVLGADRGGQVSMFDDFNIDYNKYLYLIETRCSGALVKLKSAIVVKRVAGSVTLLTPTSPTFNSNTGVVTIPTQTGVVYKDAEDDTLSAGAQAAIGAGETVTIHAVPSGGSYAFDNSEDDTWSFTRESS
jgi:hypothetical protein